jgi:CRISPR-associated protein Csb3
MIRLEPAITVRVDPTNPGQFFACCGLLELADRLWPGAEGWFDHRGRSFYLAPLTETDTATAAELLGKLRECRLSNTMTDEQLARLGDLAAMKAKDRPSELEEEKKALEKRRREEPIVLHEPFGLRVDWFLDDQAGGDRFKTWAGQQSVLDIAQGMKQALAADVWASLPAERWLTQSSRDEGLPFNFDSDLGGQGSALDVGFSFDPLKAVVRSATARPLLELAAFVGLQRFRSAPVPDENRYRYSLWTTPLPPEVACVAACGAMTDPASQTFEFRLLYRTQYLKSFLPAQPIRGD